MIYKTPAYRCHIGAHKLIYWKNCEVWENCLSTKMVCYTFDEDLYVGVVLAENTANPPQSVHKAKKSLLFQSKLFSQTG